jgi:cadmium resistance protein CadD (predicted permease)
MLEIWANILAVVIVSAGGLVLLLAPDWRLRLIALAGEYLGVFLLVLQSWPFEMAVVKLVAGWMAGSVLGMAIIALPIKEQDQVGRAGDRMEDELAPGTSLLSGLVFRILAALLIFLTVFSVAPQMLTWVPGVSLWQVWGSLILMGMGLLQLGFTAQPFRTILALLTILAGFEILYASVESSALVAGLLASIHLGLSLVGAYLILAPQMEEAE